MPLFLLSAPCFPHVRPRSASRIVRRTRVLLAPPADRDATHNFINWSKVMPAMLGR